MKREFEKQAEYYRGYAIADRSLAPLTVGWATIVALWFLVYLGACIGQLTHPAAGGFAAQHSTLVARRANP